MCLGRRAALSRSIPRSFWWSSHTGWRARGKIVDVDNPIDRFGHHGTIRRCSGMHNYVFRSLFACQLFIYLSCLRYPRWLAVKVLRNCVWLCWDYALADIRLCADGWSDVRPMERKIRLALLTVVDGESYAVGGCDRLDVSARLA